MAQDYIVISAFNEGHIARRYKDSKFILVKGSQVSQTFNTIKGLSDTWKKDQIKWSNIDGEPVPERKSALNTTEPTLRGQEITSESPSVLPASENTGDANEAGSGDSSADTPSKTGAQLGQAPSSESQGTAPEVAEGGEPAPVADAKTKPVKPTRTAKK